MSKGERLRHLREEKGFSLTEAAESIGVSKQTLYKYEKDIITNIPSDVIERIAILYETSPAFLMGWQEQMKTIGEEMVRQTKPITDFFKTHTIDYNRVLEALVEQYGEQAVERAFIFVRAYLEANPERQKIALEILQQSHQDKP